MKNVSQYSFLTLSAILMGLSSCNSGGGKNSNNQPVAISGVTYSFIGNSNTESCDFTTVSSYTCRDNFNGQTPPIPFNSQQELCNLLNNENVNRSVSSAITNAIAYNVRQTYVKSYCQAYVTNLNNNNFNTAGTALKNMTCNLTVTHAGDTGESGTTGEMPMLVNPGVMGSIWTGIPKSKRFLKIFNWNHIKNSSDYIVLNYLYTQGSNSAGDTLKLKATLPGSVSAEVTGYAGSDVRLEIENYGSLGSAVLNCRMTDSTTVGQQNSSSNIRCKSSNVAKSEKRNEPVQNDISVSSLLNEGLVLVANGSATDISISGNGSGLGVGASKIEFTALPSDNNESNFRVFASANLSTASKFKIKRSSEEVTVDCK